MKTILFAMLALSSAHAWAVEWQPYHEIQQNGGKLYYDLDSLRQDRNGFEVDIRYPLESEPKEILALLSVECAADRYRLSHGRTLIGGATEPFETPETWSPVERTPIATLKNRYCAYWYEPDGVRWQAFAETPRMIFYQLEDNRPEPPRFQGGVAVMVKAVGKEQSYLTEISILCQQNQYVPRQFVLRDEKRGIVTYSGEEYLTPIEPGSALEILKTRYCATPAEIAANPAEETR